MFEQFFELFLKCVESPPRLPVNKNYPGINAAAQEGKTGSHLEIFRSLLALRKDMAYSSLSGDVWSGQDVLAFGTTGDDDDDAQITATVVNLGDREQTVDLSGLFHDSYELGEVVVAGNGGLNAAG